MALSACHLRAHLLCWHIGNLFDGSWIVSIFSQFIATFPFEIARLEPLGEILMHISVSLRRDRSILKVKVLQSSLTRGVDYVLIAFPLRIVFHIKAILLHLFDGFHELVIDLFGLSPLMSTVACKPPFDFIQLCVEVRFFCSLRFVRLCLLSVPGRSLSHACTCALHAGLIVALHGVLILLLFSVSFIFCFQLLYFFKP